MYDEKGKEKYTFEEKQVKAASGGIMLIVILLLQLLSLGAIIVSAIGENTVHRVSNVVFIVLGIIVFMMSFILYGGLKTLKPNEAAVYTLFGKYYGTIKEPGFYYLNPFVSATNPAADSSFLTIQTTNSISADQAQVQRQLYRKKISLKVMTLSNEKQKINDLMGNPIIIGIVVIWKVVNTAKAVFNVDNYKEYLTIQCDSALRNIVRMYPYDVSDLDDHNKNEQSLRGSSEEIALKIREELQSKVDIAGLEIVDTRITHLAYAPEIAAAMLQRQQASAVVDARQMIVDGAVGMVEMALDKLNESDIVKLDEERKASMVSNLLVVLCGSKDAQPVINSGSLY